MGTPEEKAEELIRHFTKKNYSEVNAMIFAKIIAEENMNTLDPLPDSDEKDLAYDFWESVKDVIENFQNV